MISADTIEDNTLLLSKTERVPHMNPELNTIRDYGVLVDELCQRWFVFIKMGL